MHQLLLLESHFHLHVVSKKLVIALNPLIATLKLQSSGP